jgi:hypothetical protein
MLNIKTGLISCIAIAAAIWCVCIGKQNNAKLRADKDLLQEQRRQLNKLGVEHDRLAAKQVEIKRDDHSAELASLRKELASLQKQTNELVRASETNRSPQLPSAHPQEAHSPEYYAQLHQLAGAKTRDAMNLGGAFFNYVGDHQGQSPTSLDQLTTYLRENMPLSGNNQFEIIFHGSLDSLNGLPWGSVAVIRETQAWPNADGQMSRVYGFPDGHAQIVGLKYEQSWEAQHVIQSQEQQDGP